MGFAIYPKNYIFILFILFMVKPTVIITGCGYKSIRHVFTFNSKPTHKSIEIGGKKFKMNIGSATAFYLAKKRIPVIMVSRTKEHLEKIKEGLIRLGCEENLISFIATDLTKDRGINYFIENLPKNKQFYWVQSIGMGGGTYKIPHDNIYLPFEKISPELISVEQEIVPVTHKLMLRMIPIFRKQIKNHKESKICVVTSMSGERGYHFGATHVAAKHSLVGYIKGIKNELNDEGIKIYDIRPGAIDTGMYDDSEVKKSIEILSKRGHMYPKNKDIPVYASPLDVAKKIHLALFGKNPKEVYRILAPFQK